MSAPRGAIRTVCIPGSGNHSGGPGRFVDHLTAGFASRGVAVTADLDDEDVDAVLVVNATRAIPRLWRLRASGVPIVQRLGNLLHQGRVVRRPLSESIGAELRTRMMTHIRARLAEHVIYQSRFVHDRWERHHGPARGAASIIHNGTDTRRFSPDGPAYVSEADLVVLSVEGTQGYDPFDTVFRLADALDSRGVRAEILMVGRPYGGVRARAERHRNVKFVGPVPHAELPYYFRGANVSILTDVLEAGCPNSVLESLSCGTPVIGYYTGVLPELVDGSCGRLVDPGADVWAGESPADQDALADAALAVREDHERLSAGARKRALTAFSRERMVENYLAVLERLVMPRLPIP